MASDILRIVTEALGPDVLHKISGHIGESQQDTKAALGAAVPAVLAGMIEQATSGGAGLTSLVGMLISGKIDSNLLTNLGSMMHGSAASGLLDTGRSVITAALGSKASQVENTIAAHAGVQPASAVSILGMAGAMVMAAIGKQMGGTPSVSGLTSLLTSQKPAIMSALPAGLGSVLGRASLDIAKAAAAPVQAPAAEAAQAGGGGIGRIIGFIVVGAAILGGVFWYMNNGPADVATSAAYTAKDATSAVTSGGTDGSKPAISALGEFFKRRLPNGAELNIPKLGIENKLVDYIDDAAKKPDDATWFDFDRLLFDTGASTLQASSQEQLQNIAEILKAYPKVKVRIGGYTDNIGDKDANLKLSGDRAHTVMAALVKLGVDASRMDAKGYGEDHPAADNATGEGRAKNRRISMRVIEK